MVVLLDRGHGAGDLGRGSRLHDGTLAGMATTFIEPGWGEPEEMADAVAFLLSDEARFITAEHLSVDGGMQYF